MEESASKGSKICHCVRCQGGSVERRTFFRHLTSVKRYHDNQDRSKIIPSYEFNEDKYLEDGFQKPLYNGANVSVLDAVLKHFYVFALNNGMTKSALSDELKIQKSILPQPNSLPNTYSEAKAFVKPLLIPLKKYEACVNDCVLFRDNNRNSYSALDNCPKCDETKRKTFTYMPLGPRFAIWFGTKNLCKLLYAGVVKQNGTLSDFRDGEIYQQWYEDGNVFQAMEEELTVPLSLFADGLNPNKNISQAKSMWSLILTWINLPKEIRQLLGPMLLMGIIPSGMDGSEPKSLEPYFEVVVDELLDITDFPVYHAYLGAPVNVKVALLQYLCDIPAYSKVLHLSGHGALRSCPYCKDVGVYCKELHKTIHLSNRKFLQPDNSLRKCPGFVGSQEERDGKPKAFTDAEEREMRQTYDAKPNKSQKNNHQKTTGMKGHYILMDLPYHKRMDQMQPDGMHTLADFISTIIDLLIGKSDTVNVRSAEKSFGRFPETWIRDDELARTTTNDQSQQKGKSKKRKRSHDVDEEITKIPPAPWTLSKECLREAERRAKSIIYPHCIDKTSKTPFTKPWTLRTMNSKLQFVTSGAFKWCIQGLLPNQQEETLFHLFDLYKKIITPQLEIDSLADLEEEAHSVLSTIERDFPVTLQNLVSHLIHHIVDGFRQFGPLYGRWLFPYERANGWITRQCLKKGGEESTVMETYAIYDMCVYMILANKFTPEVHHKDNSILKASERISDFLTKKADINSKRCQSNEYPIPQDAREYMKKYYKEVLMKEDHVFVSQGKPFEAVDLLDISGCRYIKYTVAPNVPESKRKDSSFVLLQDGRVGRIESIFEHAYGALSHHWLIVDMFPAAEKYGHFSCVESKYIAKQLVHSARIVKPLVISKVGEMIWILNM